MNNEFERAGNLKIAGGGAFILKIYRDNKKLLIDLDGDKNVEIVINISWYWACFDFWGRGKNYEFQFTLISANLVTHYRID
ncbi:hypothetical protein ACHWQZ_G003662 [Mnemiopsis leidyi]